MKTFAPRKSFGLRNVAPFAAPVKRTVEQELARDPATFTEAEFLEVEWCGAREAAERRAQR